MVGGDCAKRYPLLDRLGHCILQECGLEPSALRLEVTENQVVSARGDVSAGLKRLKALGIGLSMDDFGTGLSPLSGLHRLPFIKIDRTFVTNLTRGKHFMALAQSVVSLAQNLGMMTVAEGIETHEQVVALQSLGCPYGQGYLFSKPLSEEELVRLMESRGQTRAAARRGGRDRRQGSVRIRSTAREVGSTRAVVRVTFAEESENSGYGLQRIPGPSVGPMVVGSIA